MGLIFVICFRIVILVVVGVLFGLIDFDIVGLYFIFVDMMSLIVWYDGVCFLCCCEIVLMWWLDWCGVICFVDVSIVGDGICLIGCDVLLVWFYVEEDGVLLLGVVVFVVMWWVILLLWLFGLVVCLLVVLVVFE